MSRFRVAVGDVFSIPLDEERICYGQVVATYKSAAYYFAVFETPYRRSDTPNVVDVVSQKLAFLALSMDAKLYHGDWTIVGRTPVSPDMPFPVYKLGHVDLGNLRVEDYTATRVRPATEREANELHTRSTVAPVRLEKAIRARHGLEAWDPVYRKLEPDWDHTTARLFP